MAMLSTSSADWGCLTTAARRAPVVSVDALAMTAVLRPGGIAVQVLAGFHWDGREKHGSHPLRDRRAASSAMG